MIRQTLGGVDGVVAEPAPQIGIARFGESAIEIGIRYWVPTAAYFQTQYAANAALHAALHQAGIRVAPRLQLVRLIGQGNAEI